MSRGLGDVYKRQQRLLEKILAIPEKDASMYLETLDYIESLILKIRR